MSVTAEIKRRLEEEIALLPSRGFGPFVSLIDELIKARVDEVMGPIMRERIRDAINRDRGGEWSEGDND